MDPSFPAAPPRSQPPEALHFEVSIIVPARNEEACLAACLESLTAQSGLAFEIIVVNDASTDRTREIAESFAGVRVLSPEPLPESLIGKRSTGKNNAVIAGAKAARGEWLLFTDADTVHRPGSLLRALDEAKKESADLLSYSPEQEVVTFSERAVMPLIFAELAAQYPLHKMRDQNSGVVAANGQYIFVCRVAYDAVGGHAAVASDILEDVALARLFRAAGKRFYFRYGGDAVRTRMYRNWPQLREGWTKNLALLFPHPGGLALRILFWWFAAWLAFGIAASNGFSSHFATIGFAFFWFLLYRRIRTAHFSAINTLIAITLGPPLFAYLLLRSNKAHMNGQVSWKGRTYSVGASGPSTSRVTATPEPIPTIKNQRLRTEN